VSSAAEPDVWVRTWIGWDLAFYAAAIAMGVTAGTADDLDGSRTLALAGVAGFIAWYAAFGSRAMRTRSLRLGIVYLAGMIPLFLLAFSQYGLLGIFLFVLYPQCWALVDSMPVSVVAASALSIGVGLVAYFDFHSGLPAVLAQSVASLAFSLLLGFWVSRVVDQSAARRTAIADLEATRAELATVSHRAGVLAERERLAREIHDTLAQGFTSVVVLLELAESDVDTDPAAARRRLVTARETARQNLAEARSLVAALTPVDLQVAPLPEALGRLTDRFDAETGLPARLEVCGDPRPLAANQEVVLLRSAQEALANVRRHAGASAVTVTLRFDGAGAMLSVADDGAGFDPDAATGGYGLAGMRRRVEEIGGALTIHSGPAGTTAEVRC
jgi:signal transduction histidine kinase